MTTLNNFIDVRRTNPPLNLNAKQSVFFTKNARYTNIPARLRLTQRQHTLLDYQERFGKNVWARARRIQNADERYRDMNDGTPLYIFENVRKFREATLNVSPQEGYSLFRRTYPYEWESNLTGFSGVPIDDVWVFRSQSKRQRANAQNAAPSYDYYRVLWQNTGTPRQHLVPFQCSCPEFRRQFLTVVQETYPDVHPPQMQGPMPVPMDQSPMQRNQNMPTTMDLHMDQRDALRDSPWRLDQSMIRGPVWEYTLDGLVRTRPTRTQYRYDFFRQVQYGEKLFSAKPVQCKHMLAAMLHLYNEYPDNTNYIQQTDIYYLA